MEQTKLNIIGKSYILLSEWHPSSTGHWPIQSWSDTRWSHYHRHEGREGRCRSFTNHTEKREGWSYCPCYSEGSRTSRTSKRSSGSIWCAWWLVQTILEAPNSKLLSSYLIKTIASWSKMGLTPLEACLVPREVIEWRSNSPSWSIQCG